MTHPMPTSPGEPSRPLSAIALILVNQWTARRQYAANFSPNGSARAAAELLLFMEATCDLASFAAYSDDLDTVSDTHVRKAASQVLRRGRSSEWLKWAGFFLLGIAVPLVLAEASRHKHHAWPIFWLVLLVVSALGCLTAAILVDRPWRGLTR